MTIDHDAISDQVRASPYAEQVNGAAYLDLYDEVAKLRVERDEARDWLAKANNEFGSQTWSWPNLWQRIAQLKELSNERWKRAEKAEAERDALRAALTIYAQSGNWRLGGCCDPNSPNFTGEAIARAALKGDSYE